MPSTSVWELAGSPGILRCTGMTFSTAPTTAYESFQIPPVHAPSPYRNDDAGLWSGLIRRTYSRLQVSCDRTCYKQHIGVPRRRNKKTARNAQCRSRRFPKAVSSISSAFVDPPSTARIRSDRPPYREPIICLSSVPAVSRCSSVAENWLLSCVTLGPQKGSKKFENIHN